MTKEEYLDELELIKNQNNVEAELYPLISKIIEFTLKGFSSRYVFGNRRFPIGHIYFGISSFPDIAIINRDFKLTEETNIDEETRMQLKGCIEVKQYEKPLLNFDEIKKSIFELKKGNKRTEVAQLIGEIIWYKKVLYTNGVKWKLYTFKSHSQYKKKIIEVVNKRKNNTLQEEWWNDSTISKIIEKEIKEEIISNSCIDDWDNFIIELGKITWDD